MIENLMNEDLESKNKLFAHVDKKYIEGDDIADFYKAIKTIQSLDDYKSFNEIIDSQKKNNFPGKFYYKLRLKGRSKDQDSSTG